MKLSAVLALAVATLPVNADAQTAPPTPKLHDTIVAILTAGAAGECPAKLLAPVLQYNCQKQQAQLQAMFQQSGAIKDAAFVGFQQAPDGSTLEAYRVTFERGQALWLIAADQGGRAMALFPAG